MENKGRNKRVKQVNEHNEQYVQNIHKENVCLKRDNELNNKIISVLEHIKDKLEMKVFLLTNNCECNHNIESNADNAVFVANDKRLAQLYEQYITINKLNANQLKCVDSDANHINIEPQVILNVDYNSDECDNHTVDHSNDSNCGQNRKNYKHNNLIINKQFANNNCSSSNKLSSNGFHIPVLNSSKLVSVKRRRITKQEMNSDDINEHTLQYMCHWDKCGKIFKNSDNLSKHQRIHMNDKRFKCDWPKCDYECVHSYSLTFHMRLHTGEKPYVCDWPDCDYRCAHSYSMVFHKRKHTGEKKYVCDCGYSARMLTDFKRHQVRHTGIKPSVKPEISGTGFKCDFNGCGKWCKSLGYMKTHIRKKHQIGE